MQQIIFNCQTITPMFLAGANGTTPELRPPSIKGALRFWWRAMNGHLTLQKLRAQEGAIFGDTQQRSKIIIQVNDEEIEPSNALLPQDNNYKRNTSGTNKSVNILEYLAYGVVAKPGSIERSYFPVGSSFQIKVKCPDEMLTMIKELFEMVSLFGGFGSRSRNGYGSFLIESSKLDIIQRFKKYKKGSLKNYSAFSEKALLFTGKDTHDNWEKALLEVGDAYRTARLALEDRHYGSQRKMIAQPLSIKDPKDTTIVKINGKKLERNAKCFFIGVTKEDKKYKGHILYLPHTIDELDGYQKPNNSLANHLKGILTEIK